MSFDQPLYLDHNAATPLLPEVVDAMLPYLRVHFAWAVARTVACVAYSDCTGLK